jgi:putative (di)nucleoside polyphosphate hydrolase
MVPAEVQLKLPYRSGVGIVVFNADGLVLMGERHDFKGAWQFPQGGIDAGEDPWTAAQRELYEETGIKADKVSLLGSIDEWLAYDFPQGITGHPIYGHHAGQKQKWFAVKFLGTDADIQLDAYSEPEFVRTQWYKLSDAPKMIVDFKQAMYQDIIKSFSKFTK